MHLKSCQREQGSHKGSRFITPTGKEPIACHYHDDQGQGRRESCSEHTHIAWQQREQGNEPMKERWFIGNVSSVVDRQYPVPVVDHRQGDYSLTGLTLGVELRQSYEWQ